MTGNKTDTGLVFMVNICIQGTRSIVDTDKENPGSLIIEPGRNLYALLCHAKYGTGNIYCPRSH
jgi:hypothetical protein